MRDGFILLLAIVLAAGCSSSREEDRGIVNETTDSAKHLTSQDIALEKTIWKYYVLLEEEVGNDLGVSQEEIVQRVQSLIDDGYVRKPVILVNTKDGPKWAIVDYSTYKEYMTSNALVLRRYYGTQPDILDTVSMDSIKANLLRALNEQ